MTLPLRSGSGSAAQFLIDFALAVVLVVAAGTLGCSQKNSSKSGETLPDTSYLEPGSLADFVEEDFPFITTTVDARGVAPFMPERNLSVRGLAIQLGNDAYVTFDPDLLRMSAGWIGEFVSMETMAQVSYDEPKNKANKIPKVLGTPLFGTGIYPGWMGTDLQFEDPRPPGPNPQDVGRGPLPKVQGQWQGVYVHGRKVVLAYKARGTSIREQPGSLPFGDGQVAITRTIQTKGVTTQPLTLVLAEVEGGGTVQVDGNSAWIRHGEDDGSVTAAAVADLPKQAQLEVERDRYLTLRLPADMPATTFKAGLWTQRSDSLGAEQSDRLEAAQRENLDRFRKALRASPVQLIDYQSGGNAHWPEPAFTRGRTAPDTSAFVLDRLTLPLPNRWKRNVRVADIDFLFPGRARGRRHL